MPDDLRTLTLAEAFAERFEGRLEGRDVVPLGPASLIAAEADGDLVLTAALEVQEDSPGEVMEAAPLSRDSEKRTGGLELLR